MSVTLPRRTGLWSCSLRFALLLLLAVPAAQATTFEPPDFERLVRTSEQIVRGRVLEIASSWTNQTGQPLIETMVRLQIAATEKGPSGRELTLRLLGGRIGDEVLQVDAMPALAVGEDVIVFIQGNGRNVCPFVGWGHGVYRIIRDESLGRDYVARANGEPLVSLSQVPQSLERERREASVAAALSPAQLLTLVRGEQERQARAR